MAQFLDLSCGPTLELTIVLQPLRTCEGISQPGRPGRVASARNHVNEAIACRLTPHAPAGIFDQANDRYGAELVKVRALSRFAEEGNAAGLRGILGARL
ncbi:hypothetical protein ABIA06_003198 [Bradyrhizobium yuanmingense]